MKHLSKNALVIIVVIACILLLSLLNERKDSIFTTQEINVSRGYHNKIQGELFFNKATYVQISVFKLLDKLWVTNLTDSLLND